MRDPHAKDAAWIVDAAYMPVSNKLAICALDRTCVPPGPPPPSLPPPLLL
jgi:hypothetical protein